MPSLIKRLSNDKSHQPPPSDTARESPSRPPPQPQVNSWLNESATVSPPNSVGRPTASTQEHGSVSNQTEGNSRNVPVSPSRKSLGSASPNRAAVGRSRMMPPSLSLPAKTGRARGTPRIRYNRTPVRFTVCGEWALKECEVSDTWS